MEDAKGGPEFIKMGKGLGRKLSGWSTSEVKD